MDVEVAVVVVVVRAGETVLLVVVASFQSVVSVRVCV